MDRTFGVWKAIRAASRVTLAGLAASAALSCAKSSEVVRDVDRDSPDLAALMADEELPVGMMPPTMMPPTPPPPRFCDIPVSEPGIDPPRPFPGFPGGPMLPPVGPVAGGGSPAMDAGIDEPAEPAAPGCASFPVGFWRFDDCNPFRTDLSDSSFDGHTAFRTVDLTCRAGREGLAASFAGAEDMVFVPDQPRFGLERGVTVAAWVHADDVRATSTLFRKRDDANSAFALILRKNKYQFVVRLTSGELATVSAPAEANTWTHVAATYDGEYLRLYLDGMERSSKLARGTLVRGAGPLLIGNDGSGRRFSGRVDSAWFNTLAAPASTIASLTCLRRDPAVSVAPLIGPTVPAGTPVTYTLTITNGNEEVCEPASFFTSVSFSQGDFVAEPQFEEISVGNGETFVRDIIVRSGTETEAGNYPFSIDVISNSGVVFPGPGPIFVGPSVAGTTAPPVPEDEPPPGPTGFVNVQAEYVVAEPDGCHVSSQRALMIRHVSVVDDPVRTVFSPAAEDPNAGVWSFGRLMENLSPRPGDAPDLTEDLLRSFLSAQTINGFEVAPRPPMDPLVLAPWPRTTDGKLDLARAPMRLLAITHRLDLKELHKGKGGEGRFTYGVIGPEGFPLEFTVIFEYFLPARGDEEFQALAQSIHALQELPFPSEEYNRALQAVTERYTGRDASPGAPNGSALIDVRTNELSLSQDGQWQLREFRLSPESGRLAPHPLFQTPDASFNFGEPLGRFVNDNEAIILTEFHETPLVFEEASFSAGAVFNNIDFWNAVGIANPEARHKFSLNTCNGCHGAETQTAFLHIFPREVGRQSNLSGYLTGIDVFDPVTGQPRRLSELARRRALLETVLCPSDE